MSAATGRAELLADGGTAAETGEFFRSRPFLDAEGATHTLRILTDEVELLAPLIVREIPGGEGLQDAVSPYGYPGVSLVGSSRPRDRENRTAALDPASVDFSATGLISVFLRHTLGGPPLRGARDRNVVQIADPALPPKTRSSDRNQINRNRRAGYQVRIVPGPESVPADREAFLAAYEQTMHRTAAAEHYFFGADYFARILESELARLALVSAPDGTVAAASILARSDGFLHYYLSGSVDSHLRDSPMKNLVAALVELAGAEGLPLNLGGGISRGDRLEEFKRGFANREQAWSTSEIVCDPAAYERLSAGRDSGDFFPAYRAG